MLISITIPVYNNPVGLKLSLESLINQSYKNWEAIIVDDGSDKDLSSIVLDFNDDRIVFHRFKTNKGRPAARQKTFELLSGDYCGFLDAGDTYNSDFLLRAMSTFSLKEFLGVSQSMTIVFDGSVFTSNYDESSFDVKDSRFDKISFASTIFKSEVVAGYKFNEKLKFSQDRHFLNYVASNFNGDIALLNTHGYYYHQGDRMLVSTTFKKYYYDMIRIFGEAKIFDGFIGLIKLLVLPLIHWAFGYKRLLNMRFKKNC